MYTRCATAPKLPHGSHRTTSFSSVFYFISLPVVGYIVFVSAEGNAWHASDFGPEPMTHFDPGPKSVLASLRERTRGSGNRRRE